MLKHISIRDFALIESTAVQWTPGLNVLTGETGAGKSILMDALDGVLGGRLNASVIRAGKDKAYLEATFETNAQVVAWLKAQELIDQQTDEVVIAREIGKSGSKIRVNGTLINQQLITELRALMITFHAQHEARTLMAPHLQLDLLDSLGGDGHRKQLEGMATLYARKRDLQTRIESMKMSEEERARKLDFGQFQLEELNAAQLHDPDEDEQIAREVLILANAIELKEQADAAQAYLNGDGDANVDESTCAVDLVQKALVEIERALKYDPVALDLIHESMTGALAALQESATAIRRYKDSLDTDPETLQSMQDRQALLSTIKRKYGPSLADAVARRDTLSQELEELQNSLANADALQAELDDLSQSASDLALIIRSTRQDLARGLSKEIQKELADLGMEKCRFEISFSQLANVTADGADKIEFLIAPNPGQPAMPLGKIASGGELSRIMLSLKTIFANADKVSTVVFDEIDTGLSGRVLNAVRDKLLRLSRSHQILCITHQPIVASIADNYLEVKKEHLNDQTTVTVVALDDDKRLKSLAAMASGNADEAASLSFARSLVEQATQARSIS
ncbi:MAG: DNA repair protein RecN [Candidatus Melainabacteria bacterium]|nr:DNA repair protein RecN [Candidatus Melainabacteria bacterium]